MLGPVVDRVAREGRKTLQWLRATATRRPILTGVVAVLLLALGTAAWVTGADGRRASLAFAALAKSANDAGNTNAAVLYALRGLRGHDTFLFGYRADEARAELLAALTEQRAVLRMETGSPRDAVFSPDGGKIALLSWDSVHVVDSVTGEDTINGAGTASGLERSVGIAFNAAGDLIAATFEDGGVLIRAEDGAAATRLAGNDKPVSAPTFNGAGTLVAAAAREAVVIWNVADRQPRARHAGECGRPGFSADGKRLLAVCADRVLHVWDVASGDAVAQIALEDAARVDLSDPWQIDGAQAFRADIASRGSRVLNVTRKGAFVWSTDDGTLLRHFPHGSDFKQVATLSDDGGRLAISGNGEGVCARIWDVASGREQVVVHHDLFTPTYTAVAFSPDSNRLLTAKAGSMDTIVWDVAKTPDRDRLVGAPGWFGDTTPAALSALSGAELFQHACAVGDKYGALRASSREVITAQKIATTESIYSCDPVPLSARVRAAFGVWTPEYVPDPIPEEDGAKRLPPAIRVTYRYEWALPMEKQATFWIEDQGARMARRDHHELLFTKSQAYWDGRRTFTRNNDDVVLSTPFLSRNFFRLQFDPYDKRLSAQEQMGIAAFSLYRFAPERSDIVAGRPCTVWTDRVPAKGDDGDDTHHEICVWNGLVISEAFAVKPDGTSSTRRVATEIVEDEPIPADLKALAGQ
jgi:WD40 repeat protein